MVQVKKCKQSLWCLEEAKEIMEKMFGPNKARILTLQIYNNLGDAYGVLGEEALALHFHEDAFNMYCVIYGEKSVRDDMATVCFKIARDEEKIGNLSRAKKYYTKAAEIYRRMSITEKECRSAVVNLYCLSVTCEVLGKPDEALKHLEEAREIAKAFHYKSWVVLDVLHRLGKKYNNEMGSFAIFVTSSIL